MVLFLVFGGLALATLFMLGKLFVPRSMHAGYDRAVNSFFLNVMRVSIIGVLLVLGYFVLIANGIVK